MKVEMEGPKREQRNRFGRMRYLQSSHWVGWKVKKC